MKKISLALTMTLGILLSISSCQKNDEGDPEVIVFNKIIDWQWELGEWYGGNSFYWWHRPDEGDVIDYGEMSLTNWKSPTDFENGNFYMRFKILEQPTDSAFVVQLGIWQDKDKGGGHSETISSHILVGGGAGASVEAELGVPGTWWELRTDEPVDFKRPEDFYRIGVVLWKEEPRCLPMAQGWNNSNSCENPETEAMNFFPMKASVTVIAVAAGHAFSGWENYP